MPPTIKVRIPKICWDQLRLTLRNLAILLQADLIVSDQELAGSSICLSYQGRQVEFPMPDLRVWRNRDFRIEMWRDIPLAQPSGSAEEAPDLVGLAWYLFHNHEELSQQAQYPDRRYDITRSAFAAAYKTNYLDRALREATAPLGLPQRRQCAVILTHDLDILSRRGLRACPWNAREALHRAIVKFRSLAIRDATSHLLGFYELIKSDYSPNLARFEFLDWAKSEADCGFRSVFFAFAPNRQRTFRDDACYGFSDRNSTHPKVTLYAALRDLVQQGFVIGPHLSRSSDYLPEQIDREFDSLSKLLNIPITATRNHWLWIRYSDWYHILQKKRIAFDFNQAAIGFPKGTSYPYLSVNHQTLVFPTTYMDDAVFNSDRLNMSAQQAFELLTHQLDTLQEFGGCIALSFHPAEDAPREMRKVRSKIAFYGEVLAELTRRRIPVLLPNDAKYRFDRKVVHEGGST
jgi:hypothetical protein